MPLINSNTTNSALSYTLMIVAVFLVSTAKAHVVLVDPVARTNDNDLIDGPCGGKPAGDSVASYSVGQTIEITADLVRQHKRTLDIFITHDNFVTKTKLGAVPTPDAGIYKKIITLPSGPEGSAILQVTDGEYVSCADITLSEGVPFIINAGLNDAWFFPDTQGQGFFIVVYPDIRLIFLAWFTYETERPSDDLMAQLGEPGQRWVTAQGPFDGNMAQLDIIVTSGGVFDRSEPEPENSVPGSVGTMKLMFNNCSNGLVEYDMPGLGLSGTVPLQRVANDNVALCEVLSVPETE